MSSIIDSAKTTLSENLGGVLQSVAPGGTKFSLSEVPDQTGKVAVITGGSEGIGYGTSHTLLSRNISKLYILSMSEDVVKGSLEAVKKEMGEEVANRTKWIQCDMYVYPRIDSLLRTGTDSWP